MKNLAGVAVQCCLAIGVSVALLLAAGCGGDDDGENAAGVSCQYEERSTGCGGGAYGAWESVCESGYASCGNIDDFATTCSPSGSCCINIQRRGISQVGSC